MSVVYLFVLAWFAVGLTGSALILEFGIRRNDRDVTVGDTWYGVVLSSVGPLAFLLGAFVVVKWLTQTTEKFNPDRVVFRRHEARK